MMPLDSAGRGWTIAASGACLLPLLLQLPPVMSVLIVACGAIVTLASWRGPVHSALRLLMLFAVVATVLGMMRFSIGRDTGCALLAAMCALKPAETFTLRDGRSLIGFSLFGPFGTFLLDQGPISLGLSVFAVIVALSALLRLSDRESGDAAIVRGYGRSIGDVLRLFAIGLPLALITFWLFPRLGSPLWGFPERAMGSSGLSDRMAPGQWLDMMSDESPALRVRFFGDTPRQSQMYWRGPVLWNFDGREWTQPSWMVDLSPAPMRGTGVLWDYEIQFEPTERRQLVALDLPLAPTGDSRLSLDHSLYSLRTLSSLTRWRLKSSPPSIYQADLHPNLRRMALALPEGFNPRTLALARQWRAEAGSSDGVIVQRALNWIRRDFAYTLSTPPPGRNSVDEFLFDQRAGFCQHFSSSFVVLMRGAGIPARVVTGYTGGYRNPIGGYWLVRRSDAHAWAEVWIGGRGWVRVDPTAAVAPERIYDTLADRAPSFGLLGDLPAAGSLMNLSDWMRRGWNDFVLGFDAQRQERLLSPLGIDRIDPGSLALIFGLFAALTLLWMVWLSARGERVRDPVLRAWHGMTRRYRRLRLERLPHESALDWAERVGKARPDLARTVLEISQRFSDWRYADGQPGQRDARELRKLVGVLRAHRPGSTGER